MRQRIQQDGLKVEEDRCFLDEGYSGTTLLRPALERLRDLAHCGVIDRLYVHSPDRLARKYVYQMLLLEEFSRHSVEVIFLNHDPQDRSAEANLLLQVQGMIAEYERAKILERTRRGRRFAAQQGKLSVMGHAPYGYRYVPKQQGEGDARYEIVADDARIVPGDLHLGRCRGPVLGGCRRPTRRAGYSHGHRQAALGPRHCSRHPSQSGLHRNGKIRQNTTRSTHEGAVPSGAIRPRRDRRR